MTAKCLIIPDVHQNIAWVERILGKETGYDQVVFLGDYFDTRISVKRRTGVAATCDYLNRLLAELNSRVVFLLGNHDIQYLEAKSACDLHKTPRNLHYKCGSAYSHAAAAKIAKGLMPAFWSRSRLFIEFNGWLLSHAGIAAPHWPRASSVGESLASLDKAAAYALVTMKRGPHPLLQAGKPRGGEAAMGGLTWLDWDEEFEDELPLPQIVGHTPSVTGARKKGRSWCLDGNQTCYGLLTGKELTVRVV